MQSRSTEEKAKSLNTKLFQLAHGMHTRGLGGALGVPPPSAGGRPYSFGNLAPPDVGLSLFCRCAEI
jgi:hypothetical protein